MIDLLCCFCSRDHPIRLNREFHKDIQWWSDFLTSWHGVSLWLFPGMSASTDVEVTSDAAGSLGFGAYIKNEWFSGAWAPPSLISQSLTKNSFQWWLLRTCGVHDGSDAMSCSALTTRLWCTFLRPKRRKFRALCSFCTFYCLRQLDIVLPLLLFTYLAFITRLLMLSPVSIGRSSGIWCPRLYRIQPQFLTSCGIF